MNINKKFAMFSLLTAIASSAAFAMPGKEDEASKKAAFIAARAHQRLQNLNAEKAKLATSTDPKAQARFAQLEKAVTKVEEQKTKAAATLTQADVLKKAREDARARLALQKEEKGTTPGTQVKKAEKPSEQDAKATALKARISQLEAENRSIAEKVKSLETEKETLNSAIGFYAGKEAQLEDVLKDGTKSPDAKVQAILEIFAEEEEKVVDPVNGQPALVPVVDLNAQGNGQPALVPVVDLNAQAQVADQNAQVQAPPVVQNPPAQDVDQNAQAN